MNLIDRQGPMPDLPGVPTLLRRVYGNRGIASAEELQRSLASLARPTDMQGIRQAAQRIAQAVREGQRILLIGDFDADGATSVALGVSLLQAFGASEVDYLVPNRFEFGYGLSSEIAQAALNLKPDLMITVDNGVSSVAGVDLANAQGVDVIVTDHHLPGPELPRAYAIVNPNVPGCGFPSKAIAGVGVIYYVLSQVRRILKEAGWFADRRLTEPVLAHWLDLVALGTVADLAPLDRNNRALVHQGLLRMRKGCSRPGIRALAEIAGRNIGRLQAADLGFALAPRLNAAGRLSDMSLGIRCLLAPSLAEARALASSLDELNRARREIQRAMLGEAELLASNCQPGAVGQFGLSVFDEHWHQGVIGLVAGRLRERLNRPVIAFAPAGPGTPGELKGSARSLPELHIRDALDGIASRNPGLLVKFGGHAAAAGLSIGRPHYRRFAAAFDQESRERLPPSALQARIEADGELDEADLTLENAQLLAQGGPWGQAFPEPSFRGEFQLITQRVVGEEHLKLVLKRGERLVDAIAFGQPPLPEVSRLLAVYRLTVNDYGPAPTVQLQVEHLQALG